MAVKSANHQLRLSRRRQITGNSGAFFVKLAGWPKKTRDHCFRHPGFSLAVARWRRQKIAEKTQRVLTKTRGHFDRIATQFAFGESQNASSRLPG
jgi:hypothetical protein